MNFEIDFMPIMPNIMLDFKWRNKDLESLNSLEMHISALIELKCLFNIKNNLSMIDKQERYREQRDFLWKIFW